MRNWTYGYGMMGDGGLGWVLMVVGWVLFVAGVVALLVWIARRSYRHDHGGMMPGMHPGTGGTISGAPTHDEAVAIARKRFAAGEITKDQFDEIMTALG